MEGQPLPQGFLFKEFTVIQFIIGIDPGKDGGIAVLKRTGEIVAIVKMPLDSASQVETSKINLYSETNESFCFLEKAFCMPKQGATSTFTCGLNYGKLLATIEFYKVPYEVISAQKWKKYFGLLKKDKRASVAIACKLFPKEKELFYTPRGRMLDGLAEAVLIAEYGRRVLVGAIK